jgi:KUP system potassium uptake protein
MLVWFVVLGGLGLWHISDHPAVFAALNPLRGLWLLVEYPGHASAVLGAIVLTITGSEALYADLGHFGRGATARAWCVVVCPGLLLNYFGQGAYAIAHPGDTTNPFFALAPQGSARLLLTALSIAAAVIASQALISGTFSLVRQAIQLGYFPRLFVKHTNAEQAGQIYLPLVNTALALGSIWIVLAFRSSTALAGAYGTAITCTMVVTTFAFFRVTRQVWHWRLWRSLLLCGGFLTFDLTFFTANLPKIPHGGWLPIGVALAVLAVMHTWKVGRGEIFRRVYGNHVTDAELVGIAHSKHVTRVGGAAVFMVGSPKGTPVALLHHVKANRCLHQTVVLLSIITEEVPTVHPTERLVTFALGEGLWRATGRYGYMESPDVGALLEEIHRHGVPINPSSAIYFFNREMIITEGTAPMWEWQKRFYGYLSRNARPAKDYYQITPSQIIEIGLPIQL